MITRMDLPTATIARLLAASSGDPSVPLTEERVRAAGTELPKPVDDLDFKDKDHQWLLRRLPGPATGSNGLQRPFDDDVCGSPTPTATVAHGSWRLAAGQPPTVALSA